MAKEKKRTSQKEMLEAYAKEGVEGLRDIVSRFPNSKLTFNKVIEHLGELGKDTTELESLRDATWGAAREYVSEYDNEVLGSTEEISSGTNYTQAQLYVLIRKYGLEPVKYYKQEGVRGKGTSLYDRQEVLSMLEKHESEQAEKYLESYDTNTLCTSEEIAAMFPDEWDAKAYVSPFLKLFNIDSEGEFRQPGSRGSGRKLYRREAVERAVACLTRCRSEV